MPLPADRFSPAYPTFPHTITNANLGVVCVRNNPDWEISRIVGPVVSQNLFLQDRKQQRNSSLSADFHTWIQTLQAKDNL